MSLSDLIRAKNREEEVATAIPAIPATDGQGARRTVARIATVAVANPGNEKTADPRPALYRQWLGDIQEPRALVTLTEDQVRRAVAAGIVAPELAERSVILCYRSADACGLLAVPKDRYDGLALVRALEAMQWHQ